MSKYSPFATYLKNQTADEVRLSFADIERILGDDLPPSARAHVAWWANSRTADTHNWAHLWLEAGWERRQLDLAGESVVFHRFEFFDIESPTAREGYEADRTILARGRNAALASARKERDAYTCQACHFSLEVGGKFVIEVHHLDPLSATGETTTTIDDLVSLCPTCHRVAHLRSPPYAVQEIQQIRGLGQSDA